MSDYRQYKGVWMNFGPEEDEQRLSANECRSLLKKGGFMVRNVYDFDCKEETQFWYVILDHFDDMDGYNGKMRNQVRRSLRDFEFRLIDRKELAQKGYPVHCSAAKKYRVKADVPTQEAFLEELEHGVENEFWGAYDRDSGNLVAFAKNQCFENSCNYSVLKATPEAQKRYVYYGLIHEMNRYYLQQRGMDYVNDGARTITEHSNIQGFLIEKYHFRKAYCHLQLFYRPLLRILVRLLYPLRNIMPVRQVKAILMQEEMSRPARQ